MIESPRLPDHRLPASGYDIENLTIGAERRSTDGGVDETCGVAAERFRTDSGVVETIGVVPERLRTEGGIEAAGSNDTQCARASTGIVSTVT